MKKNKQKDGVSDVAVVRAVLEKFPKLAELARARITDIIFYQVNAEHATSRITIKPDGDLNRSAYVFDKNGAYLGQVGYKVLPKPSRFSISFFIFGGERYFSETVSEALDRFPSAHYLIAIMYDDDEVSARIASPAQGKTIKETLQAEAEKAKRIAVTALEGEPLAG